MNSFNSLMDGFASALTLSNLGFGLLGTFLGTLVGVLPGIGPALAIALLLPITYTVSPASALIMFAAIYYGAMYGGSTTSILLNTPGESGSVMTALEGNKMARRGRAGTPHPDPRCAQAGARHPDACRAGRAPYGKHFLVAEVRPFGGR